MTTTIDKPKHPSRENKSNRAVIEQILTDSAESRSTIEQKQVEREALVTAIGAIETVTGCASLDEQLTPLLSAHQIELSPAAKTTMKLVDRLFDSVVSHSNLAEELKYPLNHLRLVYFLEFLQAPAQMLTKEHPARNLLNSLVSIGLMWDSNDPRSQQIKEQISATIDRLNRGVSDPLTLTERFFSTSDHFEQFSMSTIKRAEIFEKRIREAELGQAKAEAAKLWARQTIELFTSKQGSPDFVVQMLNNAWQHVLFLEYLKTDNPLQIRQLLTAKALIVSLQQVYHIDELAKFLDIQPELLKDLRANLQKTSYSFAETSAFFEQLDVFHNQLIANAQAQLETGSKEEILRLKPNQPFQDDETSEPEAKQENIVEDMSPEEWVEFAFEKIETSDAYQSSESQALGRLEKDAIANATLLENLRPDRWLQLTKDDKTTRCKLATYVEASDKYILVTGSGGRVAELSSEQAIDALQSGELLILDNTPLFSRALKSIIRELYSEYEETEFERKQIEKLEQKRKQKVEEQKQLQHQAIDNSDEEQPSDQVAEPKLTAEAESIDEPVSNVESISAKNDESESRQAEETGIPSGIQTEVSPLKETEEKPQADSIRDKTSDFDEASLKRIAVGSWVELFVGYKMKKCRLAAKIASTGKLIFTDRSGIKVKECTADDLIPLYQQGKLKIDLANTVFDKALESVISNMRELKSDAV